MHPPGLAAAFRHLVHAQLVHSALVAEKAEMLVIAGCQKFLDIIVIASVHGGNAFAAPLLLLVIFQIGALHVAAPRKGNDNVIVGNQILDVNSAKGLLQDFCFARRGISLFQLQDFLLHLIAQYFRLFKH